jgi:hypothetical protein
MAPNDAGHARLVGLHAVELRVPAEPTRQVVLQFLLLSLHWRHASDELADPLC